MTAASMHKWCSHQVLRMAKNRSPNSSNRIIMIHRSALGPASAWVATDVVIRWSSGVPWPAAVMLGAAVVSPVNGATVRSKAQVLRQLIDDTEATDWQAGAQQSGGSWNVNGLEAKVNLAGSRPGGRVVGVHGCAGA